MRLAEPAATLQLEFAASSIASAAYPPRGPRAADCHPFFRAHADPVTLESRDQREHVKAQPTHRVGWVASAPAETEGGAFLRRFLGNVAPPPHWLGKPAEFRHDEGVAFSDGGERLAQSGSRPVRAGEAVIDADV
ncbi:hypothetical protein [Microbacterium pullorum]